jgi:uncharacterized protein (TIGR02217 family)
MSWLDTPFPSQLAFGVQCRPGWLTTIAASVGGFEDRNQQWEDSRHSYDASAAVQTGTHYKALLNHFHMARGRLHTWGLKDPVDHRVEASQGIVADTTENSPLGKQLYKRYGSGSFRYDRRISRPINGTILVYENGTLRTEGVDYTLDYSSGEMFSAMAVATITWSGKFYTPCRYDTDDLPAAVIQKRPDGELLVSVSGVPILEDRDR